MTTGGSSAQDTPLSLKAKRKIDDLYLLFKRSDISPAVRGLTAKLSRQHSLRLML